MTAAVPFRLAFASLPPLGKLNLALLLLAVGALSAWLWTDWGSNPDLSHGFFMPVVFLLLLHESRQGTARYLPAGRLTGVAFGLLLGASLTTLSLAGLYAAAVDWTHPLIDLMLALAVALLLAAALVSYSSETKRLIPFNWTALLGVGLWLLVVPLPPGTYMRLTLNLQLLVSEGVLRALHLLGIAAVRHGNVIDLANASVGVEEACSGVRSLISCVFAGFFFSATLVRRPWARALILGLAAPLALGMNFLRSLALTLLVNQGVDISGTWHDATGFAVLGVTAAVLGGLALLLDQSPKTAAAPAGVAAVFGKPACRSGLDRALTVVLGLALALIVFFAANTRPTPRSGPVPDLLALLPESAAGFQVKTSDLFEFTGTLATEHLAQRHYLGRTPAGEPLEIVIYVAYWPAGQAPVSLVSSHTPDACWPGSGWTLLANPQPQADLTVDDRPLPRAEHRIFQGTGRPQNVWFWHLYDGQLIPPYNTYSVVEMLKLALTYGFRHAGDQVFVRVSSNRPWSELRDQPLVREFFSRVRPLGL